MAEEVRITNPDFNSTDSVRVTEWETGLPTAADLPPLSQILISSELASAFSISPEPHRNMVDVDRASCDTLSSLRNHSQSHHLMNKNYKINDLRSSFSDDREEEVVVEGEGEGDLTRDGSDSRKLRRVVEGEGADSARTLKRIRLVWTPQLHKRFVEVVAHLGVKSAVPKTIMQLMNVEGLTRENVASHLQKYRLYLKRMQWLSNETASSSDQVFGLTPVSNSLRESGGNENGRIPMAYQPQMVPVPYQPPQIVPGSVAGFEYNSHPYNVMMQPKDWSGKSLGSVSSYQHNMTPSPSHK